jgi:hypothetical protein
MQILRGGKIGRQAVWGKQLCFVPPCSLITGFSVFQQLLLEAGKTTTINTWQIFTSKASKQSYHFMINHRMFEDDQKI